MTVWALGSGYSSFDTTAGKVRLLYEAGPPHVYDYSIQLAVLDPPPHVLALVEVDSRVGRPRGRPDAPKVRSQVEGLDALPVDAVLIQVDQIGRESTFSLGCDDGKRSDVAGHDRKLGSR